MIQHRDVTVATPDARLEGSMSIPRDPRGLVLFAHGSGGSRHSSRNRHVSDVLARGGLATLLFDLLTADEEALDRRTAALRFDIPHLVERLVGAVDWTASRPETRDLDLGCFGSSTGAAAALVAAAERPDRVRAVVSRGGRPDLAGPWLESVRATTLLIVGGRDDIVLDLNRRALEALTCEARLVVVPGATHLFEESGALDRVAVLARDWFRARLGAPRPEGASR